MGQTGSRRSVATDQSGGIGVGFEATSEWSLRRSLRRLSKARGRSSRRSTQSLSHAFSAPPLTVMDADACLVNVNTATEEQLMTLPGVSRILAAAIVDHRQTIGRFRRVDDVALVPGMGAERLNNIRLEICVRKTASNSSSRTQSLDSVRSCDSGRLPINVNTASVFQLQCVPGLNQELAANIVDYRQKKGNFKYLDDLIKVKGMDKIRLSSIKSRLNLYPSVRPCESFNGSEKIDSSINESEILNTSDASFKNSVGNGSLFRPIANGHRKTLSVPLNKYTPNFVNGFSLNSVNDIFDLLSAYSHRPVVENEFNYCRESRPAFRIATWNLYRLSREKANNPGFREVVCRTILENRFSIICIQDILDSDALKIICDELNSPVLRRIIEWRDNSRKWQYYVANKSYVYSKNVGFIYETFSNNVHIQLVKSNIAENGKYNEPSLNPNLYFGYIEIKVNDSIISLLNAQVTEKNPEYSMTLLCEMIDKLLCANKKIIIAGDFFSTVHIKDLSTCYKSVIDPYVNTLVNTTHGEAAYGAGGILVANEDADRFTGVAGVIRSGLCHLAIPCGWTWGGPSSPFCPVWAEFYIM